MNYRKSLGVFARFKLITEVSHWDEKFFFMTHRFTINENIIAEGTSKGAVRDKDGVIAPEEVIAAVLADRGLA